MLHLLTRQNPENIIPFYNSSITFNLKLYNFKNFNSLQTYTFEIFLE